MESAIFIYQSCTSNSKQFEAWLCLNLFISWKWSAWQTSTGMNSKQQNPRQAIRETKPSGGFRGGVETAKNSGSGSNDPAGDHHTKQQQQGEELQWRWRLIRWEQHVTHQLINHMMHTGSALPGIAPLAFYHRTNGCSSSCFENVLRQAPSPECLQC